MENAVAISLQLHLPNGSSMKEIIIRITFADVDCVKRPVSLIDTMGQLLDHILS
jgi:hypothetical protein